MSVVSNISVEKVKSSRIADVDPNNLVYGRYYSDHMFVADFKEGKWQEASIQPFGKMELSPSISALHYGQSIFEGLKAFKNENNEVRLFRHLDNYKRMNISAERMGMPEIPEYFFSEALIEVLKMDRDWIPSQPGCSLYIRPVMFATDEKIGVHISDSYRFVIFTTPVGVYFPKPLKTLVETKYARAVNGGVGYAKAAGNYGASMHPSRVAHQKGYDQIIWTDAQEHKYFEEAGTMNIMVVIDNVLITPPISNTTLAGVTRDSILTLAKDNNVKVEERRIGIDEVITALNNNKLQEIIGVGTAATVTNIAQIGYNDIDYSLPPITEELLSSKLKKQLEAIRLGKTEDKHNWTTTI